MKKIEIVETKRGRRVIVSSHNHDPSMTDDQYVQESDANYIMDQFAKGHAITHLTSKQGLYIDAASIPDFPEAMRQVGLGKSAFESLPSELREKFHHKPELFIQYLQDPKNDEEAISLGLKTKTSIPEAPEDKIIKQLKENKEAPKLNDDKTTKK